MFGQRPRHCFLLLRRIFRASPVDKCAEFILFLFAARAAQWEKAKSVVFAFSANLVSRNFFQADERNFRELKTTPRARGYAADRGGFPLRRAFQGHTASMRAAFTFPARALRHIGCAGAKAWFCLRRNLKNRANSPFFAAPLVRRKGKKSKV